MCLVPSCPWMSVDEAGVGGNAVRGMVIVLHYSREGNRGYGEEDERFKV